MEPTWRPERRMPSAAAARRGQAPAARRAREEEGEQPDRAKGWAVERILTVRAHGAGLQVVLRWAGQHDDEWVPYARLRLALQREAKQWARTVIGRRQVPFRGRPYGAARSAKQAAARFKRLVRGVDRGGVDERPSLIHEGLELPTRLPRDDWPRSEWRPPGSDG
jgi:hypothetical protein